jgi:hypothetical protein
VTTTLLPTLAWNLSQLPAKKEVTIEYVRRLIHKGLTKNLFGYGYFQSLLYEFLQVITPDEIRTSGAPIMADHLLPLLSTRNGVNAACLLISYGTPKDRKRFAKCLKGYSQSILLHHDSYLAILRLVQVTDDTVAIQKNILAELIMGGGGNNPKDTTTVGDNDTAVVAAAAGGNNNVLKDLLHHDNGVKLFLMLLHDVNNSNNNNNELLLSNNDDDYATMMIDQPPPPLPKQQQQRNNKISLSFLDPYEQSVLFESPNVAGVPTSKKPVNVRAREHWDYVKVALWQQVLSVPAYRNELFTTIPGQSFLTTYYRYEDYPTCLTTTNGNDGNDDSFPPFPVRLAHDAIGHRTIQKLAKIDLEKRTSTSSGGGPSSSSPSVATTTATTTNNNNNNTMIIATTTSFSRRFLDSLSLSLEDLLSSNRGAFCAVALFDAVPDHAIWQTLNPSVVQQAAAAATATAVASSSSAPPPPTSTTATTTTPTRAGYDALLKAIHLMDKTTALK